MKKVLKNRIFLVIICAIFFTSFGAYASAIINARDISYTNSNSDITNVGDAIDELYTRTDNLTMKKVVINLNSLNVDLDDLKSSGDIPEDVDLDSLTANNFIISIFGLNGTLDSPSSSAQGGGNFNASFTPNYDNSTHVVSINGVKNTSSNVVVDAITNTMGVTFHLSNVWASAQVLGTIYLVI